MTSLVRALAVAACLLSFSPAVWAQPEKESHGKESDLPDEVQALVRLGRNNHSHINESSGLAQSGYVKDAVWTLNDSGNPPKLFLLRHDGQLVAELDVTGSVNQDWEALTRFSKNKRNYLLVADVGDNARRRKVYDFYWLEEPDLSESKTDGRDPSGETIIRKPVASTKTQFVYPDGSKNCEAVAVDQTTNSIWLVEKVYFNSKQKKPPGVYKLPLELTPTAKPRVARRVGEFPVRNVTGMAFSPDGSRMLIRNYLSAHMYSRKPGETWEQVINTFKPVEVVLPLQRGGEAVCFSHDSSSVIVTSEFIGQDIWQINLKSYLGQPRVKLKKKVESQPDDK